MFELAKLLIIFYCGKSQWFGVKTKLPSHTHLSATSWAVAVARCRQMGDPAAGIRHEQMGRLSADFTLFHHAHGVAALHRGLHRCLALRARRCCRQLWIVMKFLFEALTSCHRFHQASHVFDVLAWCYQQSRVSDPADLFEVITVPSHTHLSATSWAAHTQWSPVRAKYR